MNKFILLLLTSILEAAQFGFLLVVASVISLVAASLSGLLVLFVTAPWMALAFLAFWPQVWWWAPALASPTVILLVVLAAAVGVRRGYAAQFIFSIVGAGSGAGAVFVSTMMSKVQVPPGSVAIAILIIAGTIAGLVAGIVFGRAISDD